MPTQQKNSANAGSIDPATTSDWQAVGGDLSGDWSDIAHWSTGAVPGGTNDVAISDDGTATSAWTVTATNESAAALTLAMNLGTLKVAGLVGLTVNNTLTQTAGTVFVEPLSGLAVGVLVQTAGAIVMDDNGDSDTPLESSGTDTVDGAVTLVNGANWIDQGLFIGDGLSGSSTPVSAGVTLAGGSAPSQLVVALGATQIGGDPDAESAGGSGTLSVDNGSAVTTELLTVLNHSVVSVDAESSVVVGPASSNVPGAIAIEGGAPVSVDIATFDAGVSDDGTLAVVSFVGNGTTADGDLQMTGSLFASDLVTVSPNATLGVGGFVEITGGTVDVGAGGLLQADQGGSASFGVYLDAGSMTLDGGTLHSMGSVDFANGNAALSDGGEWTNDTLAIAPGFTSGPSANVSFTLAGGSTLSDGDVLFIGNDPNNGANVTGGVGTLQLSGGSTVKTDTIELLNGSVLSLDSTSSVAIGAASVAAGAVAVASGNLMFADIGAVDANVADAGSFEVGEFRGVAGGAPGNVQVTGSLTGAGDVFVTGTLELGGASGFAGTLSIAGGGELILDTGDMPDAMVGPSSGEIRVNVAAQSFDPAGFSPTYDDATGLLVFGDAASQSTLDVGPGRSLGDFTLAADDSGTLITWSVPCFAAGTRLEGEHGDVAVELLAPGDRLVTLAGSVRPVRWVGRRRIDCRAHPTPGQVWPVRVTAGAFGAGAPRRALLLSPDHAVWVQGALIPIRHLINHATIRQERVDEVIYVHVELPVHDVILAEGLAVESFLDTGNRGAFDAGADGFVLDAAASRRTPAA